MSSGNSNQLPRRIAERLAIAKQFLAVSYLKNNKLKSSRSTLRGVSRVRRNKR